MIDLDAIHEMLAVDGSSAGEAAWRRARREAARLANLFLADGIAVVVAEGSFNAPRDRAAFAEGLASGTEVLYVTLEVSFDEALRRALDDPTRGRSRDPVFLRRYFAAAGHGLDTAPETDLVLDTERMSAAAAAESIASLVHATTSG